MRDIIFKGKRKDKGEWVEGYLFDDGIVDSKRMFIGSLVITEHKGQGEDVWDIGHAFYEVIPETVGQYTGRNVGADKLFEGDIIEWVEDYDDNWGDSKTYIGRSLVIWDNDNSCWAVKTDTYIQFFNDFSWDRCYVIGNNHDNPELLEVK